MIPPAPVASRGPIPLNAFLTYPQVRPDKLSVSKLKVFIYRFVRPTYRGSTRSLPSGARPTYRGPRDQLTVDNCSPPASCPHTGSRPRGRDQLTAAPPRPVKGLVRPADALPAPLPLANSGFGR